MIAETVFSSTIIVSLCFLLIDSIILHLKLLMNLLKRSILLSYDIIISFISLFKVHFSCDTLEKLHKYYLISNNPTIHTFLIYFSTFFDRIKNFQVKIMSLQLATVQKATIYKFRIVWEHIDWPIWFNIDLLRL